MSTLEYLDDSDWSIDPEDEPTRLWIPLAAIVFIIVIFAGIRFYRHYNSTSTTNCVMDDSGHFICTGGCQ